MSHSAGDLEPATLRSADRIARAVRLASTSATEAIRHALRRLSCTEDWLRAFVEVTAAEATRGSG